MLGLFLLGLFYAGGFGVGVRGVFVIVGVRVLGGIDDGDFVVACDVEQVDDPGGGDRCLSTWFEGINVVALHVVDKQDGPFGVQFPVGAVQG
ncbi:Uncharacterised protein [Dermatophilus congolensis]|uniref:Uncharacterized protein n=1 Tax=Dermatophilus congolensis TaxID=1863 RepID=A0AA46BLF2_9MICO|nr:Uncharacterised protein [Dermatophilus congolensis]